MWARQPAFRDRLHKRASRPWQACCRPSIACPVARPQAGSRDRALCAGRRCARLKRRVRIVDGRACLRHWRSRVACRLRLPARFPRSKKSGNSKGSRPRKTIAWWLDRLLDDRRTSDYLAERLARVLVGAQDGPFLVYRRRRFVSWLADELHTNRAYAEIVRQLIASDGLWTSRPATNFITVTIQPDDDRGPDANQLAWLYREGISGHTLGLRRVPRPSVRRMEAARFSFAGRLLRTGRELAARHSRSWRTRPKWPIHSPGEMETVATAVPFAAELLPADAHCASD